MRSIAWFLGLATVVTGAAYGCGAGSDPDGVGAAGAGSPSGPGSGGSTTSGFGGETGQGGGFDTTGSTGTGGFDECALGQSTAESDKQPADIIIAIDTSGSMDEESDEVQANLNNFATLITGSGIDVHVIMIADANVCIPAPLGSGSCGGSDTLLPAYQHVVQGVASTDALQIILSTYPQWKDSLRANATKTFLVVSDDESDMSAGEFTSQLLALDPPTFQGFKFDAIVAFSDPLDCFGFSCPSNNDCCYSPGFGCASYAAAEGQVYQDLAQQTMGVSGDLCAQDFDPTFADMAEGVIIGSQLSCEYEIPPPPEGETLDPTKVNVIYTPGGTTDEVSILNVPGGAADCGPEGGWYYDDPVNPTTIFMCPATCDVLQGDSEGKVDVLFGCATEVVPE